ncbi:MAG TPA: tetratricopeptide repeat protein [Gemmatimonadales bacterium]|nr:tetratricopeptide repeat protein [Gemmatimonadales bacterium]
MTKPMILLTVVVLAAPAAAAPASAQFRLPKKLDELEAIARKDSNDAAAHYNLALAYWNAKRWDAVERELRLAVTIEPQFAEGWLALSRLPFAQRGKLWDDIAENRVSPEFQPKLDEAWRNYERAFIINPLVDLRIEAAVRPAKSIYWTATESLSDLYDYLFGGLDDIQRGNYEAAYQRFDRLIQDAPTAAEQEDMPEFVYYFRGLAAAHIERWNDAIVDFARLLQNAETRHSPDSLLYYIPIETNQYRYMLAVLYQRAGNLTEAVRYYREALENDIGLYMANARLASIAESNQNWPAAIRERRAAVSANPDDPSLLFDLGKAIASSGDWAGAEQTLKQAMEANPRDSRVPYYLGIVQQQQNKKEEARATFDRFVALAPSRYARQVENVKQRLAALR